MYKIYAFLALAIACSAVPVEEIDAASRIANGAAAANLQFPYAVSIQNIYNNQAATTRGHRCGGVLVTLRHVVTAASCMFEWNTDLTRTPINVTNYRVFAGSNLLSNDTTTDGARIRTIFEYVVHPAYQGIPSYLHDIAVLNLTTPFASATVVPLSLPAANYNPADFTECTVAGWGVATAGSLATANVEQKYINKYIYNQQQCTNVYNSQYQMPNIFPTMICAGSFDIVSTGCNGDEGNALVCGNTLTGILALHSNCGTTSSFPEIYTRVSNYTDWIRPLTASGTTFTSGTTVLFFITLVQMAFANILS